MDSKCCGCSACSTICPVGAIHMEINREGFYRPIVDKIKCIHCGLCDKVCIYKNSNIQSRNLANLGLYSAFSKNKEVREISSSGGIATEIVKQKLKDGYKVCGVVYDKNDRATKHIIVSNYDECKIKELQGSKYLQSKNEDAFKNIINDKSHKKIVIGTPCQIAGLAQVLEQKKCRADFILIEIFCHGVPSYNLWYNYLDEIDKKYNVGKSPDVIFRDKSLGWHEYHMNIQSETGSYIKERNKDIFYTYFLKSMCSSDTCYSCLYRNKSCADIRLGDYWGERYNNSEEGYSMVAINTELGREFFFGLNNIEHLQTNIEERFSQATKEYNKPKEYDKVIENLSKNDSKFRITMIKNNIKLFFKRIKKKIKYIMEKI